MDQAENGIFKPRAGPKGLVAGCPTPVSAHGWGLGVEGGRAWRLPKRHTLLISASLLESVHLPFPPLVLLPGSWLGRPPTHA